jgi:hypothetical protein
MYERITNMGQTVFNQTSSQQDSKLIILKLKILTHITENFFQTERKC